MALGPTRAPRSRPDPISDQINTAADVPEQTPAQAGGIMQALTARAKAAYEKGKAYLNASPSQPPVSPDTPEVADAEQPPVDSAETTTPA